MRPLRFRLRTVAVVALLVLAAAPRAHVEPAGEPGAVADARVVVVVRHAETLADGSSDPPLSEAGRARAEALARIAASFDVEAVFATTFRRTLGTAGTAADWLGVRPQAVPITSAGVPAHVSDVVARVRASDGAGVLVVGHSNTVPAIVQSLTGIAVGPIGETEYGRLFVVRLPADGPPTVEERAY